MRNAAGLILILLNVAASAADWAPRPILDEDGRFTPRFNRQRVRDPFAAFGPQADGEKPAPAPNPDRTAVVRAQVERLQAQAETALLNDQPQHAIACCDQAFVVIQEAKFADAKASTSLARLRKAAETVKARWEADEHFARLNVKLEGIVMQAASTRAIVNNTIVANGDCVAAAGGELLVVDEIRADCVVLRFRGFKMAALLERR